MKRSKDRQQERRYASHSNVRHSVAVEAARMLYTREFKEYFQAKREAARRQSTTVLPTNSEIHQQLLLLADKLEGGDRQRRLTDMRRVALEVMNLLEAFEPRLIGSTWTGHIRQGSDIDLNLYGDSLDAVMAALENALIPFDVERVNSRKQGHEREFLHLHVHHPSGLAVEITLYDPDELRVHPICSITGGPMARGTLPQLRSLLAEEPREATLAVAASDRARQLYPLDLPTVLQDFPELLNCRDVQQNHYHHLDVYHHTLAVAEKLQVFLNDGFQDFSPWTDALQEHFRSPGPAGWPRAAILMLAGLCHDIGKPSTWNLHRSGRIQFHGHDRVGEAMTRALGQRWDLPPAVTERVARLVGLHMEPVHYVSNPDQPSKLHEMFRQAADLAPELLVLSLADISSAQGPAQPEHRVGDQLAFVQEMLEEFFERGFLRFPNTPVSAVDLSQELGIGEGRMRERLLHRLTCAYVDGEFQGREDGLALATELLESPLSEL
jgi:predicted component of type VI protein secretion system